MPYLYEFVEGIGAEVVVHQVLCSVLSKCCDCKLLVDLFFAEFLQGWYGMAMFDAKYRFIKKDVYDRGCRDYYSALLNRIKDHPIP